MVSATPGCPEWCPTFSGPFASGRGALDKPHYPTASTSRPLSVAFVLSSVLGVSVVYPLPRSSLSAHLPESSHRSYVKNATKPQESCSRLRGVGTCRKFFSEKGVESAKRYDGYIRWETKFPFALILLHVLDGDSEVQEVVAVYVYIL